MRRLLMPLTVLGLGGLGILALSEQGRRGLDWLADRLEDAPERISGWNEAAQSELERLQSAVDRLAKSLAATR